jgi:hypothetical protein
MSIIVDTNFPGGGADQVCVKGNGEIAFSAPVDGSLSDRSLWFYFRISGAKGKKLVCTQTNMTHTLEPYYGAGYGAVRPVVREGASGEFYRIPAADTSFTPDPISYSFTLTPQSDETYVAFCFPYQYADLLRFVNVHSASLDTRIIGKTSEGRDYPALLAGNDGNPQKRLIIATARQHSGESPGSFVLEGFIDHYLGNTETAGKLKDQSVLLILPMANLDGVEEGRYGKDAPPADFNRAWSSQSIRMEIRAFIGLVEELLKTYKPGLYFDFHAPQPGGPSYIVPKSSGVLDMASWKRSNLLIDLFEELTRERGSCRRQDLDNEYVNWGRENYRLMATRMFSDDYNMETVTIETSYHVDCYGRYFHPDDWRFAGRQFCDAVRQVWFEQYDKPGVSTASGKLFWDGWEMVTTPKNAAITAKPGEFRLEDTGGGASAFFSDLLHIKKDDPGSYTLLCGGEAQIICYVHYCRAGKTALRSRPYSLHAETGKITIPFAFFAKAGYDCFQVAFHIRSLTGSLTVARTT